MSFFRCQRRPPSAPRARLQPWQLHAHAGDAEGSGVVVADQPAGKADQDRRQGGQPRPLRYLPIGRGLGVAADVCGNLVADWPVARPARASVSGGEVICDERRRQRSALMRAKRRVPAPRRSHPAVRPPPADAALVYRCPRRPNGRSCAPQPPGIRGMSVNGNGNGDGTQAPVRGHPRGGPLPRDQPQHARLLAQPA
jgi:hypothetical protein